SAVFWSAAGGHLDSLKFFLSRATIADRLYSRRRQLLHIAAAHGHVGAVRLLLSAGADINALGGDDGQSVLCRACQWGYYNVVQELVQHPKLDLDKHGDVRWTPLAAAADQGYVRSVRLLLERGADPNVLGSINWSPLQFAIHKAGAGKLGLVKLLVEAGHSVDAPGTFNRTALLRAAYAGHVDIADYLISKGAQATLSDQGNSNGLHLAAERGHAEIIRLL
ncbi:ankyrin, partial [Aspergillus violaceofuscus CBS 115571]